MKKFLIRTLIFLIPVILLAYPIDLFISYGLKHSTLSDGELEVWNDIYNGDLNSECLIYGSSRAWVHIDPIIIEKETGVSTYNLGMDAHNFYLQLLRHKESLKHNPKPKTIICGLDMGTLEKRHDLYNKTQFLPFMLWNKPMIEAISTYEGFNEADYFVPLLRYVGDFAAIKSGVKYYIEPDTRFRIKGYHASDKVWSNDLDNAKKQMDSYTISLDTMSVKLFTDFIQDCKKSNINVIFVYTPEYIEGKDFVTNRNDIMSMYNNMSEKYNVPFLDYSNDSICYQKKYFYNTMHMNYEGSEVFTKELAKDLIKYNLLK